MSQNVGKNRSQEGCLNCRARRKGCVAAPEGNASCQPCIDLNMQCLGFSPNRPDWMRDQSRLEAFKRDMTRWTRNRSNYKGQNRPARLSLSQHVVLAMEVTSSHAGPSNLSLSGYAERYQSESLAEDDISRFSNVEEISDRDAEGEPDSDIQDSNSQAGSNSQSSPETLSGVSQQPSSASALRSSSLLTSLPNYSAQVFHSPSNISAPPPGPSSPETTSETSGDGSTFSQVAGPNPSAMTAQSTTFHPFPSPSGHQGAASVPSNSQITSQPSSPSFGSSSQHRPGVPSNSSSTGHSQGSSPSAAGPKQASSSGGGRKQ